MTEYSHRNDAAAGGRRDNAGGDGANHSRSGKQSGDGGADNRRGARAQGGERGGYSGRGAKGGRGGHKRNKFHANRGGKNQRGANRSSPHRSGPQRSGYREERLNKRLNEPKVPEGVDPRELDPMVRQELRSLSKDNADMVAKHLIMAAALLDDEPQKALEHARAAKDRAGRVSVARETNGIAAYHAGEWKEAIAELRAARRMSGGPGLLAVLADAERGLGRPEKALEVGQDEAAAELEAESRAELAIVMAGAHHDLGQWDAAVLVLQEEVQRSDAPEVTQMRVAYAYADALARAGRAAEAKEWFQRAAEFPDAELLDCEQRIAELDA